MPTAAQCPDLRTLHGDCYRVSVDSESKEHINDPWMFHIRGRIVDNSLPARL